LDACPPIITRGIGHAKRNPTRAAIRLAFSARHQDSQEKMLATRQQEIFKALRLIAAGLEN